MTWQGGKTPLELAPDSATRAALRAATRSASATPPHAAPPHALLHAMASPPLVSAPPLSPDLRRPSCDGAMLTRRAAIAAVVAAAQVHRGTAVLASAAAASPHRRAGVLAAAAAAAVQPADADCLAADLESGLCTHALGSMRTNPLFAV